MHGVVEEDVGILKEPREKDDQERQAGQMSGCDGYQEPKDNDKHRRAATRWAEEVAKEVGVGWGHGRVQSSVSDVADPIRTGNSNFWQLYIKNCCPFLLT